MIDEQTKQLIIDTARIEDVVSDFVQLRRKGSGFVGLCRRDGGLFHHEDTKLLLC